MKDPWLVGSPSTTRQTVAVSLLQGIRTKGLQYEFEFGSLRV